MTDEPETRQQWGQMLAQEREAERKRCLAAVVVEPSGWANSSGYVPALRDAVERIVRRIESGWEPPEEPTP